MPVLSSEEFIKFQNMNPDLKVRESINRNTSIAFNHKDVTDVIQSNIGSDNYIGYLIIDNQIVASGFGIKESSNGKHDTIYLHTFSVHSDYRGQGLCQKIVKEFIKKFGKKYILYLTVRTEPGKENTSAIKCYEKNNFIMLPSVYRDHYDGKNNAMIRLPTNSKNSIRKRRRRTRNKRK